MFDRFSKPVEVSDIEMAFGGGDKFSKIMPFIGEVPAQFHVHNGTLENRLVNTWFLAGLPPDVKFFNRPGIDPKTAYRHVDTLLRSMRPKHEHKVAAAAWLLSKWFDRIEGTGIK